MKTIRAKELRAWRAYRKPNQRKWRLPSAIYQLSSSVTKDGKPGVLVCLEDCRQEVFNVDELLVEATSHAEVTAGGRLNLKRRRSP